MDAEIDTIWGLFPPAPARASGLHDKRDYHSVFVIEIANRSLTQFLTPRSLGTQMS